MIDVSRQSDSILRFIVFVRPCLPWISMYVAICGVVYIHNGMWTEGVIHLMAMVIGVLCYLASKPRVGR